MPAVQVHPGFQRGVTEQYIPHPLKLGANLYDKSRPRILSPTPALSSGEQPSKEITPKRAVVSASKEGGDSVSGTGDIDGGNRGGKPSKVSYPMGEGTYSGGLLDKISELYIQVPPKLGHRDPTNKRCLRSRCGNTVVTTSRSEYSQPLDSSLSL